tara:strand:- start:584 stop:781 length:198 start_codon:yes stop_codon:yes gene_type:complete
MNRLNELNIHVPLVKQEFDRTINSIASWRLTYTTKMEIELAKDLMRLNEKWEKKALKVAETTVAW